MKILCERRERENAKGVYLHVIDRSVFAGATGKLCGGILATLCSVVNIHMARGQIPLVQILHRSAGVAQCHRGCRPTDQNVWNRRE